LFLFCGFIINSYGQCSGGRCTVRSFNNQTFNSLAARVTETKELKTYYYEEVYDEQALYEEQAEYEKQRRKYEPEYYDDDDFVLRKDIPWKRKGFEFYIGSGIYFGGKKTANYYNGAPENDISLKLLTNNEYYWMMILEMLKREYPYILENVELQDNYNWNSSYNVAMDVSLGVRYRIQQNWFIELSYSFRRLTASNIFFFNFPGVPESNIENPYSKHYSRPQNLVAKEDRHYIDFSIGYIFQKHEIVKPFISLGVLFNYIRIKSFHVILEGNEQQTIDLLAMARYPNWIPGVQEMPNYIDWAGPGFGFSLTAGLKIAINRAVSLDPVFQLSVGSFGNSDNLPGFNTSATANYMAGIRIVMNDALFTRNR
jgi:opacity protein-like surface antigen